MTRAQHLRLLLPAWLAFTAVAGAASCRGEPDRVSGPSQRETAPASASFARFEFVAPHMGTLFKIVLYAPEAAVAEHAAKAAFARVGELNRVLSDYDPNSEAMRLCRQPVGVAVPVSADLFALLQQSQQLAEKSGGAFDVTLGPVVRLWREARRTRRLPAETERAAARQASGFAKLRLNEAARTVTLLVPGVQLDFGGIAKGYAADEALAVLARLGQPQAMVAASGDIVLGDPPPDAPGWKVALAPFGDTQHTTQTLVAANVGISTSGDAEQFLEIGGARYSHIMDPATGLGLSKPVAVSVVARCGALADSLATACSVIAARGPESQISRLLGDEARALVQRPTAGHEVERVFYGTSPPGLRHGL